MFCFRSYITTFLVKLIVCLGDVSPNICKKCLLIKPLSFFPYEISFPKTIYEVPGNKDTGTYSEPNWTSEIELFAEIGTLMKKSSNWIFYQTGLPSRGVRVRYFFCLTGFKILVWKHVKDKIM